MLGKVARRFWPLLTVGGLLAAVAVLSVLSRPGFHHIPVPPTVRQKIRPQQTITDHPTAIVLQSSSPSGAVIHSSSLLTTIAGWICAAIAVAVVGFLIWYVIKLWLDAAPARQNAKAIAEIPPLTRREAVIAAVDAGISELARADGDSRSAIIACWVRLEHVAEAAGTPRSAGDTSSDLVERLLGAHQVSQPVLTELALLYRTARYSTASIDPSMRDRALSAYEHLRTDLLRSRSGPLADQPEVGPALVTTRPAVPNDDVRRPPSPRRERR